MSQVTDYKHWLLQQMSCLSKPHPSTEGGPLLSPLMCCPLHLSPLLALDQRHSISSFSRFASMFPISPQYSTLLLWSYLILHCMYWGLLPLHTSSFYCKKAAYLAPYNFLLESTPKSVWGLALALAMLQFGKHTGIGPMEPQIVQPPPLAVAGQDHQSTQSTCRSIETLLVVLAVITIVGVLAGVLVRACLRRHSGGGHDVERKCGSCIEGGLPPLAPGQPKPAPAAADAKKWKGPQLYMKPR